jgi:hypothetical protein
VRYEPIVAFKIEELGNDIDVDEIDYGEYIFSLSAWYSLAIREQFTPLVFDVFSELSNSWTTAVKGEYASPLELGVFL